MLVQLALSAMKTHGQPIAAMKALSGVSVGWYKNWMRLKPRLQTVVFFHYTTDPSWKSSPWWCGAVILATPTQLHAAYKLSMPWSGANTWCWNPMADNLERRFARSVEAHKKTNQLPWQAHSPFNPSHQWFTIKSDSGWLLTVQSNWSVQTYFSVAQIRTRLPARFLGQRSPGFWQTCMPHVDLFRVYQTRVKQPSKVQALQRPYSPKTWYWH